MSEERHEKGALIIKVKEGKSFWLDKQEVKVLRNRTSTAFTVSVETSAFIKEFEITDGEPIEILPKVELRAGVPDLDRPWLANIVVMAPKNVKILRDALYQKMLDEQAKEEECKTTDNLTITS